MQIKWNEQQAKNKTVQKSRVEGLTQLVQLTRRSDETAHRVSRTPSKTARGRAWNDGYVRNGLEREAECDRRPCDVPKSGDKLLYFSPTASGNLSV